MADSERPTPINQPLTDGPASSARGQDGSGTTHPRAAAIQAVATLAGERYLGEVLTPALGYPRGALPMAAIQAQFADPVECLRILFRRYAFARRGKDRKVLSAVASTALEKTLAVHGADWLKSSNASALWRHFIEVSEAQGRKPQEDLNLGVVAGLAEWAQEVFQNEGLSLAGSVRRAVVETGRIESQFFRIVEIRGVGPKLASMLLRDWIFLLGAEERLAHRDTIYVQPIDRWMRLVAPKVVEEAIESQLPDWILAGKLSKAARLAGVSGIRFNMGVSWIGISVSSWPNPDERFDLQLDTLVEEFQAIPAADPRPASLPASG